MGSLAVRRGYALGKRYYKLCGVYGQPMRVAHDLLSSVGFLGTGSPDDFIPKGTAFLLAHGGMLYLVTAKHVAEHLTDCPFSIRFNKLDGGSGLLPIDLVENSNSLFKWFFHNSSSVDIAIIPFPWDASSQGVHAVALRSDAAVPKTSPPVRDVGCGDMCHVIGLFTVHPGKSRNVAVVHTGHVAAMADTRELINVGVNGGIRELEGYLIELTNQPGLSGAPVFVRGGVELDMPIDKSSAVTTITAYKPELRLLGVWSASWDEPRHNAHDRVPVGMGVVTPAYRVLELLDSDDAVQNRLSWKSWFNTAHLD